MNSEPVKINKLSPSHQIIHHFVNTINVDKFFWPREMKMAGKLLNNHSIDFLLFCKTPFEPVKLKSLAYLLTTEGIIFLNENLFEYKRQNINLTKEPEKVVLSPNKFGEDITISNKPKTLKQFLNYYG